MNSSGPPPSLRHDRQAVSSVVAAVLLFALLTTAFTLWTVVAMPEWVADREEAQQARVLDRLAGGQSAVQRLSAADERGPVSVTVPLAADKVPFLQSVAPDGRLAFEEGTWINATFTDARLHQAGGAMAGQPSEPPTSGRSGILDVHGFRVALTTTGLGPTDRVEASFVFDDGTFQAEAVLVHTGSGGSTLCGTQTELRLRIVSSSTTEQVLQCGVGDLDGLVVDLMETRFPAALARLEAAAELTGSVTVVGGGTGSAAYDLLWSDAEGVIHVAGDGEDATGYAVSRAGGHLRYAPAYQEYPQEDLVWEAGGVVAAQQDVQVVALDPAFVLTGTGATGVLDWTLVRFTGEGEVQGEGTATARLTHTGTTTVVLTASGADVTVGGSHSDAWRRFLQDQVDLAGVDSTVQGTGGDATLRLEDGDWTLRLRIVDVRVQVR